MIAYSSIRTTVISSTLAAMLCACAPLPAERDAVSGNTSTRKKAVNDDVAAIRAAERSNHIGLAIQLGKQYLSSHPENWETRTTLARLYSQIGRNDQAEQVLIPIKTSKEPEVLRELARIALQRDQGAAAQQLLEEAQHLAPQLPETENLLGMAFLLQNKNSQAQAHLRTALAIAEDDETRYLLANSLLSSGQPNLAIQILEPLLARSRQPAAHALMATALLRSGEVARARSLAQKWLSPVQLKAWLAQENAS